MAKRKLSSSYVRKREDIKNAVVQRSVEKIRIAAGGSGYRTSGQIKSGNTIYVGSPAGTRVKTNPRTGAQKTVSKLKGKNANNTKHPGLRPATVGATGATRVAHTQLNPTKRTRPYAGRHRPADLIKALKTRRTR